MFYALVEDCCDIVMKEGVKMSDSGIVFPIDELHLGEVLCHDRLYSGYLLIRSVGGSDMVSLPVVIQRLLLSQKLTLFPQL